MMKKDDKKAPAPEKGGLEASIAALKADFEREKEASAQYFKQIQCLTADFQNFQKMAARDAKQKEDLANARLLADLLPFLDDLSRASLAIKDPHDSKGVRMILDNLLSVLKQYGLERMACAGKKFDPYYHEVLLNQAGPSPEGTILSEVVPGYLYQGRVLRHAKVCVSKGDTK